MSSFVETRDDPFPLKFWLQVTYPLLKAASFDTFCLKLAARAVLSADAGLLVEEVRGGVEP